MPAPASGEKIELPIRPSEIHVFPVVLTLNQALQVTVRQIDVDLGISFAAPDGKALLNLDATSSQSEEFFYFVSEFDGNYNIRIQPSSATASGRYELQLRISTSVTREDSDRWAASKASAEGDRLRRQRTKDSLLKAVTAYQEALRLWRATHVPKAEGRVLYNLGRAYSLMDDDAKALSYYTEALPLIRAHDTPEEQAGLLLNIGINTLNSGETADALTYFGDALRLFEELNIQRGKAFTLVETGRAYYLLGEHQEALKYYSRALSLWQELKNPGGEAYTLNLIGRAYLALGDSAYALEDLNTALSIQEKIIDPRITSTLNHIGRVHLYDGKPREALTFFERALSLQQKAGGPLVEAETLSYLGEAYSSIGEIERALEYLRRALEIQRRINDHRGEGETLLKIGQYYSSAGDRLKARDYLQQALRFWQENGYSPGEAQTRFELSAVATAAGDLEEARSQIEAALWIVESQRGDVVSARLRTYYLASAQKYYELYIDILMQLHKRATRAGLDTLALQASESSRARSLLDTLGEVRENIRQGVSPALLAEERALLRQLNSGADLQIRLLGNKLTPAQAESLKVKLARIEKRYQEVEDRIRMVSPRYAKLTRPRVLTAQKIQAELRGAETVLLEYALGERRSYFWVVGDGFIRSFELPGRAEITSEVTSFRELLTRRFQHADDRVRYADQAGKLGRMLLGAAAPLIVGKRLIIVPDGVLQFLPFGTLQSETVSTVPPDGQSGMPRPLVADHEILYEPSASTLAALREELAGRAPAPMALAVIADPVFGPTPNAASRSRPSRGSNTGTGAGVTSNGRGTGAALDAAAKSAAAVELVRLGAPIPPLISSRQEARQIYEVAKGRGAMLALGYDASRQTVTSPRLSQYRILHFSTHALLNNDYPALSGLVLSLVDEKGAPQDGFLQLYDIYNLNLGADMVVLSACHTALGKQIRGEGIVGLTRAFMYAGSRRVVATLWAVDDEATAVLMSDFYTNMLSGPASMSPAAALRQAQVSMSKRKDRWANPFYWAGFTIQGDWQP
jgi:CHAT domain-containing protein/Tfp pilus assembly protein PilF